MRVLIDYRPALRARSGVGEYTHQLATSLLSAFPNGGADGLNLTLFSSSWKDRIQPAPELQRARLVDRRVPVRLLNLAWHRLGWPPAEMLARGSFDVTHSLHPLLLPARDAAQVVMIHDLDFLAHPERTRAEIRRDYPTLVRAHAHRAHRIVVPSRFTASEVERQLGVPIERIAVCPPGAPPWTPIRRQTPSSGYILFFGTLEPRKNVAGLLDAYERLLAAEAAGTGPLALLTGPVPELVLAGKAIEASQPVLDRLTRAPLAGRARHIGYVEPDTRQSLYAGARLLVMPSFEEGFGLPVLEAMTLGVPVVAADRGALPEVLGDAGTLVDPARPDDLAAGIARVLTDDGYAAACASRGIEQARTFSWERTAHLMYDTYQQAVVERRSASTRPTR